MGQYHKIFILSDKKSPKKNGYAYTIQKWFESNWGVKLMEWSYFNNPAVNTMMKYLRDNGATRMVVCGDYAEPIKEYGTFIFDWDKEKKPREENYYGLTYLPNIRKRQMDLCEFDEKIRYIVNHTRKEFVDLERCPTMTDGYRIHPLPLLLCNSNGLGGGDFTGFNECLCGLWSENIIGASNVIPKGYKEIIPYFTEESNVSLYALQMSLENGNCKDPYGREWNTLQWFRSEEKAKEYCEKNYPHTLFSDITRYSPNGNVRLYKVWENKNINVETGEMESEQKLIERLNENVKQKKAG